MVLYVIGLGLGDEKDITVRGLEAVRSSAKVVLEHYTSILGVDKTKLVSDWHLAIGACCRRRNCRPTQTTVLSLFGINGYSCKLCSCWDAGLFLWSGAQQAQL